MAKRDFETWLVNFRESISGFSYYADFQKVYENVDAIKVELNILNSLIGSRNIEQDFVALLNNYPEIVKCIPILIAKREQQIFAMDETASHTFKFQEGKDSVENYLYFMDKTGLFDLLSNHIINNLVDYVTGIEVGLDSNGRKNRGGHQMEDLVESYLIEAGVEYYKEMYLKDIEAKWGLDLSALSNDGKAAKRFDFVVQSGDTVYAIETNFYSSGGSKLNETARSYKMLAQESADIPGFEFVWITDGIGWKSARKNLQETFDVTEYIFSIDDLESGVCMQMF